jgi:hypothetical protein
MIKAYKVLLSPLYPAAVHITCMVHILNLVGEAFKQPFALLNNFMLCFSRIFYMAGARKRRYLKHLADQELKVLMAPNPYGTRWNSWFLAVLYHQKYFPTYSAFVKSEMQMSRNPPESLKTLNTLFDNVKDSRKVHIELNIIADKFQMILNLTNIFQSRTPTTLQVYDYLEDLSIIVANNSVLVEECLQTYYSTQSANHNELLTMEQKTEIKNEVIQAYALVQQKLDKYMNEGQPGTHF